MRINDSTCEEIKTISLSTPDSDSSERCLADGSKMMGARWPSGLERWLVQATGLSWPGSNPTAENFASELWQFRLPHFASVFRRRH